MAHKAIKVRCVDTGVVYESSGIAAEAYGTSSINIRNACRRGHRAAGVRWEEVERYEPPEAKRRFEVDEFAITDPNDKGVENLIIAIVAQTVEDWKDAMRILSKYPDNEKADQTRLECEYFFLRPSFGVLTGLDGKQILARLKKEYEKRHKRCK